MPTFTTPARPPHHKKKPYIHTYTIYINWYTSISISIKDSKTNPYLSSLFPSLPPLPYHKSSNRHLGRNPFVCDCSIQWLSDYLENNPIETSGARCESPRWLQRRKLTALAEERLKCRCFPCVLGRGLHGYEYSIQTLCLQCSLVTPLKHTIVVLFYE